jgi:hypothetical protein
MSRLLPLIEPLESRYAPAALSISIDPASQDEGTGGTKTFTFKVTLSDVPTGPVSVTFSTKDGTATRADDFTFISGELQFSPPPPGGQAVLEKEIKVIVNSDTKYENDEDFQVVLRDPIGATLSNGLSEMAATATITNDDAKPTVSILDASITEGDIALGGPGTPKQMTFTVSLSNPSFESISVDLATADGTASSVGNADFVAKTQTITFNPGETSKTFLVDLNGDLIGEKDATGNDEKFTVALSHLVGNATLSDTHQVATGTIVNDDAIIKVTDVRVAEGTPTANTPNTVDMVFTVTLDRAGKNDLVMVDFATVAGTATPGVDYTDTSGTLTFQPGDTSEQIIVKVNKDATMETDDTVLVNLTNVVNATIEDAQIVGTIANDEIFASLALVGAAPLVKKEGEFTAPVTFRVTLSTAQTDPAGVDVKLLFGGTATVDQDYTVAGYTVTDKTISVHFAPGETSKDVDLTVTNDTLPSLDEIAQVSISGTTNAVTNGASSQGSFTILNDDGRAYLLVDPTTVAEAAGAKAVVTVRLSTAVEGDVTFNYNTIAGTAFTGSDFTSVSGTGKILAGNTTTTIDVPIINDNVSEANEKFTFQISNGTGGATTQSLSARPTADITITDDDPFPTIGFDSVDVVKIVEGDNGTKTVTFKLTIDKASGREVSVRAKAVSGSATAGEDFVAFDQVIKIPANQTQTTFNVTLNGDQVDEIDENFFVQISEENGVTIDPAKDEVEVKILNNDRQILIEDVTVSEGAGQVSFKVHLTAPSLHPITVKFKTSNGTAIGTTPAAAGDDYVPVDIPELVFAPGETEKLVTVDLANDATAEDVENFFGELSNPTSAAMNAVIGRAKATATITNDDAAFRISDARLVEGGPGATTMMLFTVTREGSLSGPVSVNFATQNGTAVEGTDFTQTSGRLDFLDGQSQLTISVPVLGDASAEGASENFSVKLSNPTAGSLVDGTGVGTIVDDDAAIVTITNEEFTEGASGVSQMIFVVTVSGSLNGTVRLDFATAADTATSGDFTSKSGTLTFSTAGSQTIIVPITNDEIDEEDNERFFVKLTQGSGSAAVDLINDTGVGTIHDDDVTHISVSGGKVAEGNSGISEVQYTITLDKASDRVVTADFSTIAGGSATPGVDYNPLSPKTVTFLPGQTQVVVGVEVIGDTDDEPEETVTGSLTNIVNAATGTLTSDARILNDEILATISNSSAIEGNVGDAIKGKLTINLSSVTTRDVTVSFSVNDGTAIRGTDFDLITGSNPDYTVNGNVVTVTIPAGLASKEIEVFTMLGDTKFEGDETFTLKLTDVTNAAPGSQTTGTFTIVEDEVVNVFVSDQHLFEGETGVVIGTPTVPGKVGGPFQDPAPEPTLKNVQLTVSLSGPSERPITVKASSLLAPGDNAVVDSDFKEFSNTEITFAPGETSKTITVGIIDDQIDEPVEKFHVNLTDATLGTIDNSKGTIRILDNDLRGISIGDASIVEGAAGDDKLLTFTIKLSAAATQTITVDAKAAVGNSGTATPIDDFSNALETITFNPGETSKTYTVTIVGDSTAETDETFVVDLTNATGGIITDNQANGKIVTDEVVYVLSPDSVSIDETAVNKTITFTVHRQLAAGVTDTNPSLFKSPGSVTFTTVDGTAKAGTDYVTANGVLQFAPDQTDATFTVTINNDASFEDPETFLARLTSSTGGGFVNNQAQLESTITINSGDDVAPTLSIADVSKSEGLSGTSTFVFTVSLNAANDKQDVTIDFATSDDTATSVLAPGFQDFLAQSGTLTFAKGETTKTISVVVNGDSRREADETFKVTLSGGNGNAAITDGEAIGTIVNDDAIPKLTFDGPNNGDITVIEGNAGETIVKLKLKLSNGSEQPIAVDVSLVPGTATEGPGNDFEAVGTLPRQVTFAPGETTKEVEFRILPDTKDEVDETFQVNVAAASGSAGLVEIQDTSATITISDDDPTPQLRINDVFIVEGDSGFDTIHFTVTLDGTSDRAITVDFATLDGTAVSGGVASDYVAKLGKLTFEPGGASTQPIDIQVNGDDFKEANETFQVKLSNATNATIVRDTGTGTIQQDDDTKVVLIVKDAKVTEGDTGLKNANFVVELSAASDVDTTFTIKTHNGTAVEGSDYHALDKTFTITAGSTSVTVPVEIVSERVFEATESFFVTLSNPSSNVQVFDGEGRGTIFNDDIQVVNSKTIRYVDVDGDLVTIRITKGALLDANGSILTLDASGGLGGRILKEINFTGNPRSFNGTSLFVTAEPQPGFVESGGVSDGKADVGLIFGASVDNNFIFTRGIDFNNVVIEGDLGQITAGDAFSTPAIRGKLSVDSFGAKGAVNLPGQGGNVGFFLSRINAINVKGDFSANLQTFGGSFGSLGTLTIGGALRGISNSQPGQVQLSGSLGKATIGQIVGGSGDLSGSISSTLPAGLTIGSVRVLDGILGGSGDNSGTIIARSINFVGVGTNSASGQSGIIGGSGDGSGSIVSGSIGSAVIGSSAHDAVIKGGDGESSGVLNGRGGLGNVKVFGDIVGGDGDKSGGILAGALGQNDSVAVVGSLNSVRIIGSVIGGSGTTSGSIFSTGNIKSVSISEAVSGGTGSNSGGVNARGSLDSLTVGASNTDSETGVLGGSGLNSGLINVSGNLGKATVHGDVRGGVGSSSGAFNVAGIIGSLTITGNLEGGTTAGTTKSGSITATQVNHLSIKGNLVGGSGDSSGLIAISGSLQQATIKGDLLGGTGPSSGGLTAGVVGSIEINGNLEGSQTAGASKSGFITATQIARLTIEGDLVGGTPSSSGVIEVTGALAKATIGNLIGGSGSSSGGISVAGAIGSLTINHDFKGGGVAGASKSGFITADRIAHMTVKGSWLAGTGTGVVDSAAIRVNKDIGELSVVGDVLGTSTSRIVLAAAGAGSNPLAIGKLSIGGKAQYLDVLGGYGGGATAANPLGNVVNADAVINKVAIGKNVTTGDSILATNIVAGVATGPDGRFGTSDDILAPAPATNKASLISTIAEVTIKGSVGATTEAYGIVAQHVKEISANGTKVPLIAGASNDKGADTKAIGGRETFRAVEV